MFRTLYRRLLIVILAFGLAMTVIFALILLGSHEAFHVEAEQTVNRNLARQYAAARLLITNEPLTVNNFHEGIRNLARLNPEVDIYLVDDDGQIVASSLSTEQWARRRIDMEPIRAFLGDATPLPIFGDDPRDASHEEIFSAAPVAIEGCPARYLYVVLNRNRYDTEVLQLRRTYTVNESLGLLVSCGLFALIATLVLIRSLTRRLTALKSDMELFQASTVADEIEPNRRLTPAGGDEIERLTTLFGSLSARIRTQMEALRRTDDMRRDMVANISHDLRTPLTTMQAHLDTLLLKDDELTAAERREYLSIAIRQCRRLGHLVGQLLELAKLEAGQVVARPEPFQLAELLQDISQKFTLSAAHKDVRLRAEYPHELPLVVADIGLIERVLDNLIENAVAHSRAGGAVTLRAGAVSGDRVRLEVEDTGPGIPEADQARIFERFYRGDRSRPSSSGHAGLGLAIAKGILGLHGIAIAVHSKVGVGTRFGFELPAREPSR